MWRHEQWVTLLDKYPRMKRLNSFKNVASFKLKAPNVVDLRGSGDFPPWRFVLAFVLHSCVKLRDLSSRGSQLSFDSPEPGSFRILPFKVKWSLWTSPQLCAAGVTSLTVMALKIWHLLCVLKINLLNKLLPAQSSRFVFVNSSRKSAPLCCFSF